MDEPLPDLKWTEPAGQQRSFDEVDAIRTAVQAFGSRPSEMYPRMLAYFLARFRRRTKVKDTATEGEINDNAP